MVVDDFLHDFDEFNAHVRQLDYDGEVNPFDGVEYPDISTDIPGSVRRQVELKLSNVMGHVVRINIMFLRLTTVNTTTAPHQAHNDTVMGDNTFLLYMQDGPGGLSLVEHIETGMRYDPLTDAELDVWKRDTNVLNAWKVNQLIPMKANRGIIIPAARMHRAEPIEGFGQTVEDGRICLTAFFERL